MPTETEEKNRVLGGTLYLVATPIGNLADLSERAKKVLSEVDLVAAEDTRNTAKLLSFFGISATLISYHEHNKRARGEELCEKLAAGASVALVTDAGTPAISDPGADLVALCADRGIPVTSVPGCVAGITALTLSGLPTDRFVFEGFLPMDKTKRRERLAELAAERRTFILHEAPHKLKHTLSELAETLGDGRRIALCRELTKRNEEVIRTTLAGAVEHYRESDPRGEYVLVLEGATAVPAKETDSPLLALSPEEHVAYYEKAGLSRMEATKAAARDRGMTKSELYRILHASSEK